MESLEAGFHTVGEIAIVLAGAFPLVYTVTRIFRKPLIRFGKRL
jgi:ethanolamine transporter